MPSSLGIPSGQTNGGARAREREVAGFLEGIQNIKALHASPDLDGGAVVVVTAVVLDNRDVLEVVGPKGEGTLAGGLAEVIVACVLDHDAEVVLGCKGEAGLDVVGSGVGGEVDSVADVVAELTLLIYGGERVTSGVLEDGRVELDWFDEAVCCV